MSDSRYAEWHPRLLPIWEKEARGKIILNTSGMRLAVIVNLRCGTATVRHLVKPWKYVYAGVPKYRNEIEEGKVVAIVREPFGRLVSSYERMNTVGMKGAATRNLPFVKIKNPVDRFVQFVHDVDGNIYDFHLIQQVCFIEECDVAVTDWVALENLTPALHSWVDVCGYARSRIVPRNVTANTKRKKRLRLVLMETPELRAIVERMYVEDFPLYERVKDQDV